LGEFGRVGGYQYLMNAGNFAPLISAFAQNWTGHCANLRVSLAGAEVEVDQDHPMHGELFALCSGRAASLPFFRTTADVVWCTTAPDAESLRLAVTALGVWVLPSFGGTSLREGDGFVGVTSAQGALSENIKRASPDGYYRWRCPRKNFDRVLGKLQLLRRMENARPVRVQPPRPSLYELRARFGSALLVGDRSGAEEIVSQLDVYQLETAVNTQFMRIRMWHRFGELDRIRYHPELPHILAQPLPVRVRSWIDEACSVLSPPVKDTPTSLLPPEPSASPLSTVDETADPSPQTISTWVDWFGALRDGNESAAKAFLNDERQLDGLDISAVQLESLCKCIDELIMDDALRSRERRLILPAVGEILERYVRESGFPRSEFSNLYLSLLQLWCLLHGGNSAGREHGHVLLELASALLQLNTGVADVCRTLGHWWRAKPALSQLYFALDAIELMERELADLRHAENLWLDAADVLKRGAETLPPADCEVWRRVGLRLGFDEPTIFSYLPSQAQEDDAFDPLAVTGLQHVAIVCLREKQAKQAAEEIQKRSRIRVTVVTATESGYETQLALTADVVMFVWLASTHAVLRAFDGYDKKRFCYVQGTGASSIVRSLERWCTDH
jgi:hypothetical protein